MSKPCIFSAAHTNLHVLIETFSEIIVFELHNTINNLIANFKANVTL